MVVPLLSRVNTAALFLLLPATRLREGDDKWNALYLGCGILSQAEIAYTYAPAILSKSEIMIFVPGVIINPPQHARIHLRKSLQRR